MIDRRLKNQQIYLLKYPDFVGKRKTDRPSYRGSPTLKANLIKV